MRPASVFAKPCDPDTAAQILQLLHGRHRVATRMIMIWLSLQHCSPLQIAAVTGYHPATVRRPIERYNTEGLPRLPDRPRPGAPRLGSPALGPRIRRLLALPQGLDHPPPVARPGTPGHQPAHPAPARA
jgi:Winged helix-turn helix